MSLTANILQQVDQVVLGYTAQAYQAVVSAHITELRLMLVVYFALYGLSVMQGWVPLRLSDIGKHVLKAILIFTIATNWGHFSTFCYEVFTQGPDELIGALVGGSEPSAQLGVVFDQGMAAAARINENAGTWDISQMLVGFALMVMTVLLTAYALFLLVLAKIALAVLLALGPVFIGFALFNGTQGLFRSWIHYLVNYALIPVLTLSVLGLIVSILSQSVTTLEQVGDRPLVYHTFPYLLTGAITTLLLAQVPRMASSLGEGIALSTQNAFRAGARLPGAALRRSTQTAGGAVVAGKAIKPAYQKAGAAYQRVRSFSETSGHTERKTT